MCRLTALLVVGLLLSASVASAAGPGQYEKNVAAWKPHGAVNGLEYKMALNPALFKTDKAKASFKKLWEALSAASAKNGFVLMRSEKDRLRLRTRSYYDTENLALRDAGFVVRITTNYKKDGSIRDGRRLTVKTSGKDPAFILGTPLNPVGIRGEIAAEDHPYLDAQGNMGSRLEKSVNMRGDEHVFGDLGSPQLQQFSRFVPALTRSGLTPETPLRPVTVCTYSARMGFVDLAGVEAEITFEAWTQRWDGEPVALEVSVGIEDQDYYAIPGVVAAGDEFYRKVLMQGLAHMKLPDGDQFGGSKLRMLRGMQ